MFVTLAYLVAKFASVIQILIITVKRSPDKAMNAKRLFTLHLSKKKLFILVTVNRNSYEPR